MDPQICYICAVTSVFYSRNLFKTKSKHSETRIYDFICKFLGKSPSGLRLTATNNDNDNCVCIECLSKIDEYDLASITARRVEAELRDLLLHAESSIYQESKGIFAVDASNVGQNENDEYFVQAIETIDVLEQFKVEKSYQEPTESEEQPNDFIESILADECDDSEASDSDDEYQPPDSVKKQLKRKVTKTTKRKANTNEQPNKRQNRTNALLEQPKNVKCAECNVVFSR